MHGLVGQAFTLVAGQVDLDIGGLAVSALRARGGQRIAPEVLDVLDVLCVGLEFLDQARVVVVRGTPVSFATAGVADHLADLTATLAKLAGQAAQLYILPWRGIGRA